MKHTIKFNQAGEGMTEVFSVPANLSKFSTTLLAQLIWDIVHPDGADSYTEGFEKALKYFKIDWEPTKPEHFVYLGYVFGVAKVESKAASDSMQSMKSRNPLAGFFR